MLSVLAGLHARARQLFALACAAHLAACGPVAGDGPPPATPPPAGPETDAPARDFAEEARILFRVAACGSNDPLPDGLDAKVVKAHCDEILPKIAAYKQRYVGVAKPFLTGLLPPGLPDKVVYPFGGGDLVTALTTYPDAREITTVSLELAGDPRRIRWIGPKDLEQSL